MTFQEAQAQFSAITNRVSMSSTSTELVAVQDDLIGLQDRLPKAAEFDVIADAIAEFTPKLTGQVVKAVLDSLRSRAGTLREASSLLTQVGNKAKSDARVLTLEQPKLIAAGLTEAVGQIKELRDAAKDKNFEKAAANADALVTLVQHLRGTIKEA